MAEIDQLSIVIEADATKAEKAIDGLIASLRNLNRNLDLGNLNNFTRQLKQIALASRGLRDVSNDIKSVATAGSNLAKLTGMKTLTDEMKEIESEAKKLATEVSKAFNFDLSGKKSAKEATKDIESVIQSEIDFLKKNGGKISEAGIGGNAGIYSALIRDASNYKQEVASIYEEVKKFASNQRLYIDESSRSWLEFAGRIGEVKRAFKSVSSNPSDLMKGYASIEDLNEELAKLGITSGDTKEKIESVIDLIRQGAEAAANSIVHGTEQIEKGFVPESYFDEAGKELEAKVRALYEKISADKTKNPFDGIIKGLQSLQGVTIPDFSGLNVLAESLKTLTKISPDKIAAIANALNGFGTVSDNGITRIAQEVSGAFTEITKNADSMASGVERGFELAIREVAALGTEIKEHFSGDVVDNERFLPSIRGMGASFDEEANIIDADFAEIRNEAKMATTDTSALGEEARKAGEKADNAMNKAKNNSLDLIARLVVLSHNLEKMVGQLDRVANVGIKGLKLAFKPMDAVINEYREKINGIADTFKRFTDNAKKQLDKLSAFWKRSMKTFTFMLVRKAITAVLTEINDAVKSLALWSKEYGTVFNDSMSQITSNLSYMARSIVGAFEPLINFAVPAVNALADAVANAAAKLGEFFAALTGQDYYMKAVRQVTDYGESVEKAAKAQKNLIAGLDDLNIITTPTSTASGMGDLAGQWQKVNVSDTMKDWAKAVKNAAKILFEPIQKAWDRTKDYVISSFRYMSDEAGKLFKNMATDFVKVWRQENTVKIFENLFNTIGHIATGIGNLAHNFNDAWMEGAKGRKILENIRDIVLIVSNHIESMAKSFRDWTKSIDFNPLLTSVQNFTKQVQPLIDSLGNVVESVWENIILKYHKWYIEEGAPHFIKKIGEVIDAFDFSKIENDLKPVIDAIETMMENIHTGIANAIGNIGQEVAEFANSQNFTDFCNTVKWILDQVTAERVSKLFTALGKAVLNVGNALADFVSSEQFRKFLEKLLEWYDSKTSDEIADALINIGKAIAGIKLAKFAATGAVGFINFVTTLKTLGAGGIGGALKALGDLSLVLADIAGFVADIEALTVFLQMLEKYNSNGTMPMTTDDTNGLEIKLGGVLGKLIEIYNALAKILGLDPISDKIVVKSDLERLETMQTNLVQMRNNMWTLGTDTQKVDEIINSSLQMWTENGKTFIGMTEEQLGVWNNNYKAVEAYYNEVQKTGDSEKALEKLQGKFGGLLDETKKGKEGWASFFEPLENGAEKGSKAVQDVSSGIKNELKSSANSIGDNDWSTLFEGLEGPRTQRAVTSRKKGEAVVKDISSGMKTELSNKSNGTKDSDWASMFEPLDNTSKKGEDAVKGITTGLKTGLKNSSTATTEKDWASMFEPLDKTTAAEVKEMETLPKDMATGFESGWNIAFGSSFLNMIAIPATKLIDLWKTITGSHSPSTVFKQIAEDLAAGFTLGENSKFPAIVTSMGKFAQDMINKFISGGANANAYSRAASNAVGGISQGVSSKSGSAQSSMTQFARSIENAFTREASPNKFRGFAQDVVQGFVNGINAFKNNVIGPMRDFASQVWETFKDRLGISSPSKVFAELGKWTVEGYNKGIEDSEASSERVVKGWMNDITAIAVPEFDFSQAIPKDALQGDINSNISGSVNVDSADFDAGMRTAFSEAIGGLILPYLNRIEEYSRETANKEFGITQNQVGQAARNYAFDYQRRTGRPAYGAY